MRSMRPFAFNFEIWLVTERCDIPVALEISSVFILTLPIIASRTFIALSESSGNFSRQFLGNLRRNCDFDNLAFEWMINLKENKPRYYGQNLRELAKGMHNFESSTLHLAFERSLDSGMYKEYY